MSLHRPPPSSEEKTDNPLRADDRNFYKLEKWTSDGSKVGRLLYAGNANKNRGVDLQTKIAIAGTASGGAAFPSKNGASDGSRTGSHIRRTFCGGKGHRSSTRR
jgi:hypothetical protein